MKKQNRTETLTIHVRPRLAAAVERKARDENETISTYSARELERSIRQQGFERAASEYQIEERIEELVAGAVDEIEAATRDIRPNTRRAAVYSVALWELQKSDHRDVARQQALEVAAERIDTDAIPDDSTTADGQGWSFE